MSFRPPTGDATLTTKGLIQLAGDLGGTAASPKVTKVNGVSVTGTPSSGQILRAGSTSTAVWSDASAIGLPAGGATAQVLAKESATDYDVTWIDSVPLSDEDPMPMTGVASPGTVDAVSRADHQHALNPAMGYAVGSGMYSCPIGVVGSGTRSLGGGSICMAPLPVFQPLTIAEIVVRILVTGSSLKLGVYDASDGTMLPKSLVATLTFSSVSTGYQAATPTSSLHLGAGVYWVAVLSGSGTFQLAQPNIADLVNRYVCNNGYDNGNRLYSYDGSYASLPSTLENVVPFVGNDGTFWYEIKAA